MRSCQLARTVTCGDIKHLRVPFLCSDDLWRFGSALDASVSSPRQQGVSVWPSWAVLTNEGSEMAYELRDPSSRHKRKLAHISPRFFRQPMAVHDRLPPDPRFRRQILDTTKNMRRKKKKINQSLSTHFCKRSAILSGIACNMRVCGRV
jgi:hypothetical protein